MAEIPSRRPRAPIFISVTRTGGQIEVGVVGWRRAKSSFFSDPNRALHFATEVARISRAHLLVNLGGADAQAPR